MINFAQNFLHMKKIIRILFVAGTLFSVSCGNSAQEGVSSDDVNITGTASNPKGDGSEPVMTFDKEVHDFGNIIQGEVKKYSFKFKNTGGSNLIISNASASCGCTVPEVPKQPIPPGGSSKIEVEFDSDGKNGPFDKTVTVVSNGNPQTKVLRIKGNIEVPAGSTTK